MQPRERVSSAEVAPLKQAEAAAVPVLPEAEFFDKFYQIKAQREQVGQRYKGRKKQKLPEAAPLEDDEDELSGSDADSEGAGIAQCTTASRKYYCMKASV